MCTVRAFTLLSLFPKARGSSNTWANASLGKPPRMTRTTRILSTSAWTTAMLLIPTLAATTHDGSIILAIQTAKRSRKMTASSSMPCATFNAARNSFMITGWRSTNRSRMQRKGNSPATAAPQIAGAPCLSSRNAEIDKTYRAQTHKVFQSALWLWPVKAWKLEYR